MSGEDVGRYKAIGTGAGHDRVARVCVRRSPHLSVLVAILASRRCALVASPVPVNPAVRATGQGTR
ncbi:hypothetical protein NLS1_00230 [Nocardioides sp. LS1]|nr:hypothetical protein NLS1_00230 [Nocardioides sp. LS1]